MAKSKIKLISFKVFVQNAEEAFGMQKILAEKGIGLPGDPETCQILPTPCYIIVRGTIMTFVKYATNILPTFTMEEINKL